MKYLIAFCFALTFGQLTLADSLAVDNASQASSTTQNIFMLSIATMLGFVLYAWSIDDLTPFVIAIASSTIVMVCLAWFVGSHRADD
jgi:predicted MFS family arabinose efflux permease